MISICVSSSVLTSYRKTSPTCIQRSIQAPVEACRPQIKGRLFYSFLMKIEIFGLDFYRDEEEIGHGLDGFMRIETDFLIVVFLNKKSVSIRFFRENPRPISLKRLYSCPHASEVIIFND